MNYRTTIPILLFIFCLFILFKVYERKIRAKNEMVAQCITSDKIMQPTPQKRANIVKYDTVYVYNPSIKRNLVVILKKSK